MWFLIFQGQYLQKKRWSYRRTRESYVKSERCHQQSTVHRKPCLYLEHRKLDYKKFNSLHDSPFGTMWQSSILCASKFQEKKTKVCFTHHCSLICYTHLGAELILSIIIFLCAIDISLGLERRKYNIQTSMLTESRDCWILTEAAQMALQPWRISASNVPSMSQNTGS